MVREIAEDAVNQLRELYENSEAAKSFLDWAAQRQKDAAETRIDRLAYKANIDRRDAVELARELDELGCGRFIIGRRGAKSRISWNYSLRSMGEVARGQTTELEEVDSIVTELEDEAEDTTDFSENDIRHTYQLRPDNAVSVVLPKDLSKKEAERLAAFIQSLPFEN